MKAMSPPPQHKEWQIKLVKIESWAHMTFNIRWIGIEKPEDWKSPTDYSPADWKRKFVQIHRLIFSHGSYYCTYYQTKRVGECEIAHKFENISESHYMESSTLYQSAQKLVTHRHMNTHVTDDFIL